MIVFLLVWYAPSFTVVERPNDWTKEIKKTTAANPKKQQRLEYWQAFNDYAFNDTNFSKIFNKRKPTTDDWLDFGIVEFEAVVTSHLTYAGGTSHIIDVMGVNQNGLTIRIGDRTWENDIDLSVQVGDVVIVSSQISNRWAKYFKQVYVETRSLQKK